MGLGGPAKRKAKPSRAEGPAYLKELSRGGKASPFSRARGCQLWNIKVCQNVPFGICLHSTIIPCLRPNLTGPPAFHLAALPGHCAELSSSQMPTGGRTRPGWVRGPGTGHSRETSEPGLSAPTHSASVGGGEQGVLLPHHSPPRKMTENLRGTRGLKLQPTLPILQFPPCGFCIHSAHIHRFNQPTNAKFQSIVG